MRRNDDHLYVQQIIGIRTLEQLFDLGLCGIGEGNLVVDAGGADEYVVELFGVIGCHY